MHSYFKLDQSANRNSSLGLTEKFFGCSMRLPLIKSLYRFQGRASMPSTLPGVLVVTPFKR